MIEFSRSESLVYRTGNEESCRRIFFLGRRSQLFQSTRPGIS